MAFLPLPLLSYRHPDASPMRASSFVKHFIKPLSTPSQPVGIASAENAIVKENLNPVKQRLQELLVSLSSSRPTNDVKDALVCLDELDCGVHGASSDSELTTLKRMLTSKVVVILYAECLEMLLQQSVEVEGEAEWWADVQSSRLNVASYFIQSESCEFLWADISLSAIQRFLCGP